MRVMIIMSYWSGKTTDLGCEFTRCLSSRGNFFFFLLLLFLYVLTRKGRGMTTVKMAPFFIIYFLGLGY